MTKREQIVKVLNSFFENYKVEGVCEFIVDPDKNNDPSYEGEVVVLMILDSDWIKESQTKPDFIARRFRQGLKEEIKNFTGLDVYISSRARKCNNDIVSESIATHVRRRLHNFDLFEWADNLMDNEIDICSFKNIGDLISEICDMTNEMILDEIVATTRLQVSLKEKDSLYFYLVDYLGSHIADRYRKKCTNGINETKKKYIVTESQYNLILESQKHIQFFQDLIDNRMDYIRRVCEDSTEDYSEGDVHDESCKQIAELEKVKVTDADWITIKHSNREEEEKYMSVKIMVYYSSIRRGDFDADDLAYDLERMIRKSTGMPFILNYESTNTNTFFEW